MATTSYFEKEITAVKEGLRDPKKKHVVEVSISSFSGKHELYLSVRNGSSTENASSVIFDKDQAVEFLEQFEKAMFYLGYTK